MGRVVGGPMGANIHARLITYSQRSVDVSTVDAGARL